MAVCFVINKLTTISETLDQLMIVAKTVIYPSNLSTQARSVSRVIQLQTLYCSIGIVHFPFLFYLYQYIVYLNETT